MPRHARLTLANVPLHLIQRGNNRQACFASPEDYLFYLGRLGRASAEVGVAIHAYVLMTNHVHLLVTPQEKDGASQLMKRLGQRYVQYFNRTYTRSGTLWEGRFRSCLVAEEAYLLSCQRYIELNPVRAGMVAHPADYPWSSYRANAFGEANTLLCPHYIYTSMGTVASERQAAYRELFRSELESGMVDQIRDATNGGRVLGSERFAQEVAGLVGRRTWRGKAGRPLKRPLTAGTSGSVIHNNGL